MFRHPSSQPPRTCHAQHRKKKAQHMCFDTSPVSRQICHKERTPQTCWTLQWSSQPSHICPSGVNLPAQANFFRCARIATRAFPTTTTPRHSNQAGLWLGSGLEKLKGYPVGVVAAVSRTRRQSHCRSKKTHTVSRQNPTSLKQHHFMRARLRKFASAGRSTPAGICHIAHH